MGAEPLFRPEAVAHKARPYAAHGDVLRLSPSWLGAAYRLVVAAAVVAAGIAVVARVGEYATGPAVIQFEDRRAVPAVLSGAVVEVEVRPGEPVAAGAVIAVLRDGLEEAELARTEEQYQVALLEFLRDPVDDARRAEVARWRGERAVARDRAEAKVVRSPIDGVVSDVWASPGQVLAPGDLVAAVRPPGSSPTVTALLPGRVRPLLREGMRLQLDLPGFERVWREAEIVAIGGEVVGPEQAVRALGGEAHDAVTVGGPAVVVRARLRDEVVRDDGRELPYFHGMTGQATVRVRSEPLIVALFPALRRVLP